MRQPAHTSSRDATQELLKRNQFARSGGGGEMNTDFKRTALSLVLSCFVTKNNSLMVHLVQKCRLELLIAKHHAQTRNLACLFSKHFTRLGRPDSTRPNTHEP